jgi:O-antigen/teichoic acid export membrane protein
MLSATAWLQLFDFGVSGYLRSELPRVLLTSGQEPTREYFKTAVLSTATYAGCLLLICNAALQITTGPTSFLINALSFTSVADQRTFVLVVASLSCYTLMLIFSNMFQAYMAAFQKQYIIYILGIAGNFAQPLATWLVVSHHHGLPVVFSVFCLTPLLPGFALFAITMAKLIVATPVSSRFTVLNKTSLSFLVIQLGSAILGNLDIALVSHFFGLKEAATYSIFKLLVQFPISLHAQFNLQSWPIYSMLSGLPSEYPKIRAIVLRNSRLSLLASLALVVSLTSLGPWLVRVWSAGSLHSEYTTAAIFSLYGSVFMMSNTFNMLMFSVSYTKGLVPLAFLSLPCFAILTWLLRPIGVNAVILSNTIVCCLGLAIGLAFFYRMIRSKSLLAAAR